MSFKAHIGPWLGVGANQQRVCAVKDCHQEGKPHLCLWDGAWHRHGAIHYNCEAAKLAVERSGLIFREDGWALLCDEHYKILEEADRGQ